MTSVFEEFGLSQQDVKKFQIERKLEHLSDKALCQIYMRVVENKTFRPPNPVYTIKGMWDKIEKITSGLEEHPPKDKLYLGFKDVDVIVKINDIPYTGCPKCGRSKNTLKANFCTKHGDPVALEELHITEYVISDGDGEFTMKLFAGLSPKYPEHLMVGAKAWVEGNIDLTQDPLSLSVSNFREFEAGKLLGTGSFIEDEDDLDVDRSDVEIEGFDDEEDFDENPFEEEVVDPFTEELPTPRVNGLSVEFVDEIREYMSNMLANYAGKSSVPDTSVIRAMKTWISNNYPDELDNLKEADEKLWELIKGLYTEEKDADGNIRIRYSGE